jgi:hypothetical protein
MSFFEDFIALGALCMVSKTRPLKQNPKKSIKSQKADT